MTNAVFYEQIVEKKKSIPEKIAKPLIILLLIVLILASPFLGILSIAGAAVIAAVSFFYLFPRLYVEYEYSLLNLDMDIDVIYGRSRRKKLTTLSLSEVETAAPASSQEILRHSGLGMEDYSAHDPQREPICLVTRKNGNLCKVLIQPDDRMKELLKMELSRRYHD